MFRPKQLVFCMWIFNQGIQLSFWQTYFETYNTYSIHLSCIVFSRDNAIHYVMWVDKEKNKNNALFVVYTNHDES